MNDNKLPIQEIFYNSFTLIKNNSNKLIKVAIPYIIVALFYNLYIYYYVDIENFSFDIYILSQLIISMSFFIILSVRFHRIFLLSSNEIENSLRFRWTSRETKFFGRWIMIMLCLVPIVILFIVFGVFVFSNVEEVDYSSQGVLIDLFIMAPMYYFIARFSLVLPASAIDKKETSLKSSWKLSKGNGLRLFFILAILPILSSLILTFFPIDENIVYSLINVVITTGIMPFEICFLSLSYIFLSDINNQSDNMAKEYVVNKE